MSSGIDWERMSVGWGKRADRIRDYGMPVSQWMIESLALAPGERLLELAAGTGDTGFLAAELIKPGGTLISSDSSDGMLEIARSRAAAQGVDNVEFKSLNLEWIDLPTARVDAILCRWGIMLVTDPAAAAQECRRVLAPGGRIAAAVWDTPDRNPWATLPSDVLVRAGHASPPDRSAPGMFALSAPGRLETLLLDAGFVDCRIEPVSVDRGYPTFDAWVAESLDISAMLSDAFGRLSEEQRAEVLDEWRRDAVPFTAADGSIMLPGSTLGALAHA